MLTDKNIYLEKQAVKSQHKIQTLCCLLSMEADSVYFTAKC